MKSGGLNEKSNRDLAQQLANLVTATGRQSDLQGAPYGTDASVIGCGGVPTVVFGPGSIRQAHTADEFIAVDELVQATELFHRMAESGLKAF
jgi:acetylornithine deacetylase